MADLERQELFNKILSLFFGIVFAIIIISCMNRDKIIVVESAKPL